MNHLSTKVWDIAIKLGLKDVPSDIQDTFGPLERTERNKEFLENYFKLGLSYYARGDFQNALWILSHCSELDSTNFEPAHRSIDCYFYFDRPIAVIDICNRYSEYWDGYFCYSKLLALYQLEQYGDASELARKAIMEYSMFAKVLAQKRHKERYQLDWFTVSSIEEAYSYWNYQGKFWLRTEHGLRKMRQYYSEYKNNAHKLLKMRDVTNGT